MCERALAKIEEVCEESSAINLLGNNRTKPVEFPWMAALGYLDTKSPAFQFKCAGTIISEYFILTAAHCVDNDDELPVIVRLGSVSKQKKCCRKILFQYFLCLLLLSVFVARNLAKPARLKWRKLPN